MSGAAMLLCCCQEDCPCPSQTGICSDCGECTPAEITITLDGISLCGGCYRYNENGFNLKLTPGFDINGTYCVPIANEINECCYNLDIPNVVAFVEDCDDIVDPDSYDLPITIFARRVSNGWRVFAVVSISLVGGIGILFDGFIESTTCLESGSTNSLIDDPCGFQPYFSENMDAPSANECAGTFALPVVLGNGGSATLTPCC